MKLILIFNLFLFSFSINWEINSLSSYNLNNFKKEEQKKEQKKEVEKKEEENIKKYNKLINITINKQINKYQYYQDNKIKKSKESKEEKLSLNHEECLYNNIQLNWRTKLKPNNIQLSYLLDDYNQVYSTDLLINLQSNNNNNNKDSINELLTNPIKCDINIEHCLVNIRDVFLRDKKLFIEFDKVTNQPDLSIIDELSDALSLKPSIIGEYTAIWKSPSILELIITEEYYQAIVSAYQSGSISITMRTYSKSLLQPLDDNKNISLRSKVFSTFSQTSFTSFNDTDQTWSGTISLRFSEPGIYYVFLTNSIHKNIISSVHRIIIFECNDIVTPTTQLPKVDNKNEELPPAQPLLRYDGIIAISGKQSGKQIIIPNEIIPSDGSWSLSMWLYMLEKPNGNYRCLFYKGNGTGIDRTPSAWFLPTTNRLALRTTTVSNPDLGSDTISLLPIHKWVHLTFVFHNLTNSDVSIKGSYQFSFYINGKLDISLTYDSDVLSNEHPLYLFKDSSHFGPRGFASDIIIWDSILTTREIDIISKSNNYKKFTHPLEHTFSLLNLNYLSMDSKTFQNENNNNNQNNNHKNDDNVDENFLKLVNKQLQMKLCPSNFECQLSNWYEITPTISTNSKSQLYDYLLPKIENSINECLHPLKRLDLYAEASMLGNIDSLYKWSMLIGFGSEVASHNCGIEDFSPYEQLYHQIDDKNQDDICLNFIFPTISDQIKSAIGLIIATQYGFTEAFIPLSTLISSSIGIGILSLDLHSSFGKCLLQNIIQYVPVPTEYPYDINQNIINKDEYVKVIGGKYIQLSSVYQLSNLIRNGLNSNKLNYIIESIHKDSFGIPISSSVFDMETTQISSSSSSSSINIPTNSNSNKLTILSTALLFLAALDDHPEASMILARRYSQGLGLLEKTIEVAAIYAQDALFTASTSYHKIGGQPVLESDKLTDLTEKQVLIGNSGEDDEYIQTLTVQANEGDVNSLLTLGEINYFGTRGVPRNQPQALEYYNRAAESGNSNGLCGAAGMYLKGEGTEKNISKAVSMYNQAAKDGSIRALNGLGYIYFFGHGDEAPMNKTKAFYYFLTATEYGGDSDSWFNAGYCLEHGIGVEKDVERAVTFYSHAAKNFGYFDAIAALGNLHMKGSGVVRSASEAIYYFQVANAVGPWAGWMRRGFNQYVQGYSEKRVGDYTRALMCYLHSGELGYEISQSNSAFIIRRRLSFPLVEKMIGIDIIQQKIQKVEKEEKEDLNNEIENKKNQLEDLNDLKLLNLAEKLYVRELLLSIREGNSESAHLLGNHFLQYIPSSKLTKEEINYEEISNINKLKEISEFDQEKVSNNLLKHEFPLDNLNTLFPSRVQAAYYWYSKSSAMGNSFGSLQCGLMNQFGIGSKDGKSRNLIRAERYYELSLEQMEKEVKNEWSGKEIKFMVEMLLWLVRNLNKNIFIDSIESIFGWILRWIFFEGNYNN